MARRRHGLAPRSTLPSPAVRARRWVMGSLRVLTLFLVAAAVVLYLDYRSARAAVFERFLGLGQRMAPYLDDARTTEAAREVRINGARFFVAAGHTEHPPEMVRRFYRDRYAGKDGGLSDIAGELRRRGAVPPSAPQASTFEFGGADSGGVASLDFGDGKSGIRELATRMRQVLTTGDLGELARLRYCYTERNEQGGTRFLTVWTDERLNLKQLIPPGGVGDAPGFDLDGIPRPPGSVRTLSTEETGMPQRMVVYVGVGSPQTTAMFYRGRMRTLGWQEEPTFAQIAENQGKLGLHFVRDGHEAFLSLSDRDDGQGVAVVALQTH